MQELCSTVAPAVSLCVGTAERASVSLEPRWSSSSVFRCNSASNRCLGCLEASCALHGIQVVVLEQAFRGGIRRQNKWPPDLIGDFIGGVIEDFVGGASSFDWVCTLPCVSGTPKAAVPLEGLVADAEAGGMLLFGDGCSLVFSRLDEGKSTPLLRVGTMLCGGRMGKIPEFIH